jgi:hypothetical protein
MSRPRPNFLVVGAGKCGTSSLCDYLHAHPDVFVCDPKEPGFFSDDRIHARGWRWYESLFREATGCAAVGEGTVNNSKRHDYPHAAERIARDVPDARIIYITRHPLEQIRSNWNYSWLIRAEPRPFGQALRENPTYLATCDYAWQIAAYRERFDAARILVLFFEDFRRDAPAVVRRVFAFLGVDPEVPVVARVPVNVTAERRRESRLAILLRRAPGFARARRLLPAGLRRALAATVALGAEGLTEPARWDADTLIWTLDRVVERSRAFLRDEGKPEDFWDFAPYHARLREPSASSGAVPEAP